MRPLEGIRVLDLSRLLPGPMCTWYLQGMGAGVTKVESPEGGDYLRFTPPLTQQGDGAWFSVLNAGKESVTLDLKNPVHVEALEALIAETDVLVESFRPGVMKRLGLDPERLIVEYPRLVVCSISGYGQTGPMREHPGHDLTYQAVAGTLSLAGREAGVPVVPGVLTADLAGGALTASMRICAALLARESTGAGVWLDVSMADSTLALNAPYVAAADVEGRCPVPGGELLTGGTAQYNVYRCKDGQCVAFAPLEPKFWQAFCAATGVPVDIDRAEIAALFMQRDRDDWVDLLTDACCAPVLELSELESFPQYVARGRVTRQDGVLRVSHPGPTGSATAHKPSPRLGEHTASALMRVGFDPQRLEET